MLRTQINPGSVALLNDTYSSTVDLVYQFFPVLIANGYHMVTGLLLLGSRKPGTSYGGRENGPPVDAIADIDPARIRPCPPRLAETGTGTGTEYAYHRHPQPGGRRARLD